MKAFEARRQTEQRLKQPWWVAFRKAIDKAIAAQIERGLLRLSDPLFHVPAAVAKFRRTGGHEELWDSLREDGYEIEFGERAWEVVISWEHAEPEDEEEAGEK